ncbi:MAG: hypothetical protein M3O35_06720 [Acidobacteriota bacterium]|nr:hypothetical protein [Acidobacteriota bacterium]
MKKMLSVSLLTIAALCAQAGGGSTDKKDPASGGAGSGRVRKTKARRKGTGKPSDYNEASQKATKDTKGKPASPTPP